MRHHCMGRTATRPWGKQELQQEKQKIKNFLASMNGKNLVFFYDVDLVYDSSVYRNAAVWIHESPHHLNISPQGGFIGDGQLGQPFGKAKEWDDNSTLVTGAVMKNCFPDRK